MSSPINHLENPRPPKRKKPIFEAPHEYYLALRIHIAEGLDDITTHPTLDQRLYRVVFWVHPYEESTTNIVHGLPDPRWNEVHLMELDTDQDCRYLYVEVLRCFSTTDPGTSTGRVVLGRAQIPIPWVSIRKDERFGLVRMEGGECKAEGCIAITLELKDAGNIWIDHQEEYDS